MKLNFYVLSIISIMSITIILAISHTVNAQSLANFEDVILGINFQYPYEWSPLTIYQKNDLNVISLPVSSYTTKMPDTLIERRYKGDVLVKVQNFFPLQINLPEYFKTAFSKSRFLPEFGVTELDKSTTFAGLPAYKLIYTYYNKTKGDDIKILSTNIFTVKNNKAYSISFDAPFYFNHFYQPNLMKIIDSFRITN